MLVLFRVDGIPYRPVADVADSKAAIVAAARSGGAFVPFLSSEGAAEVFISTGSTIRIEIVEDEPPEEVILDDDDETFDIDDS